VRTGPNGNIEHRLPSRWSQPSVCVFYGGKMAGWRARDWSASRAPVCLANRVMVGIQ
jgi:hypothetical protein